VSDPDDLEFLVVGGGIGGLAAACALSRCGKRVRVLEAASRFAEIGAGIQLAPNATYVLDQLGLLPAVLETAVLPRSLIFMDALTGDRLATVDLGTSFRERYGAPYIVLHRSDLLSILVESCRGASNIALEVDKRVVAVEADALPTVRCADGSVYVGQAVIGADGLHSVVRRLLSSDDPIATGFVAYRGAISLANAHLHDLQDSMVYWWVLIFISSNTRFGEHPVQPSGRLSQLRQRHRQRGFWVAAGA